MTSVMFKNQLFSGKLKDQKLLWYCWAGASISRNLWGGPTYNSQNFLAKSCEFRLHCLCVAIAHLMHFFSVLSRLRNERTVFWKKKEKNKNSWRLKVGWWGWKCILRYIIVWNIFTVFFECDLFHTKLLERLSGSNSNVTTLKTLKIAPPSLSILL